MSGSLPKPVERLIEAFHRLPGIGPKTASRLTYYLLKTPASESEELAQALLEMSSGTKMCSVCFNITGIDTDPCSICTDGGREADVLCVIESPLNVLALERTGQYRGSYHVLHGALSPVEGVGPEDLRIAELVTRLEAGGISELILATNPTLEGEATAIYLKQQLSGYGVKITRLARGLPSGGDLDYADANTLSQALEGRQEI